MNNFQIEIDPKMPASMIGVNIKYPDCECLFVKSESDIPKVLNANRKKSKPKATYIYTDENGNPLLLRYLTIP